MFNLELAIPCRLTYGSSGWEKAEFERSMTIHRFYLETVTTIKELNQRVADHQVSRTEFLAPLRSVAKFSLIFIVPRFHPILKTASSVYENL